MIIPIKQALLEGHSYEDVLQTIEETKNFTQKQRDTFLRRGTAATNTVNGKQLVAGMAPIAGTIVGGAIGNQIHGNDGTIGGVVYDEQAHNDDEFDGTGALLGLGTGLITNTLAGNVGNSRKAVNRLQKITGVQPNPLERKYAKQHAVLNKTVNASHGILQAAGNIYDKFNKR